MNRRTFIGSTVGLGIGVIGTISAQTGATEISDWNDLDDVRNDLTDDYVLVNDLDENTAGYTGIGNDFEPIGFIENEDFTSEFSGSFDGDGFSISNLVIEYDDEGDIGLFASTTDATIENLSVDGSVTVTTGGRHHGGLVGHHGGGTIQNCVSHVDVTSDGEQVGGLVARLNATVIDSYATGSVEGYEYVGGLVGNNSNGTVTDSYATGSVEGDDNVGGLVGWNGDTVTDSYATGSVEGDDRVGGLVGWNNRSTIETSYAVGLVIGNTRVGGLVGDNEFDTVTDSYWDTEATDQDTSASGGTGLTTSEMQGSSAETNMDFDFANVWETNEDDYPILSSIDYSHGIPGLFFNPRNPVSHQLTGSGAETEEPDGRDISNDVSISVRR